jgi:hypothetical protein
MWRVVEHGSSIARRSHVWNYKMDARDWWKYLGTYEEGPFTIDVQSPVPMWGAARILGKCNCKKFDFSKYLMLKGMSNWQSLRWRVMSSARVEDFKEESLQKNENFWSFWVLSTTKGYTSIIPNWGWKSDCVWNMESEQAFLWCVSIILS